MTLRTFVLMTTCVLAMGCGAPVSNSNTNATGPSPAVGALDAKDAPYIQGKVIMNGPWPDDWLTAGFVGKGVDGNRYQNGAVGKVLPDGKVTGTGAQQGPQMSDCFAVDQHGLGYRHVRMPPGQYLVFVQRNGVKLAWKVVTLKPGDQSTLDLTVDPAKAGSLTVKWRFENPFHNNNRPLAVEPAELDGSGLLDPNNLPVVYVQDGVDEITLLGVPAGKYHVKTLWKQEDVEVKPGETAHVTFKQ
jgi:hypothetical protein